MTALLVRVDIVVVLVLDLLVLLLQLSLVLLHLLSSIRIVPHVVHIHLDVHIVLRRGPLLLCCHHHLVRADRLVRIHSVGVAILNMLPTHWLAVIIHEEVALVMLTVLLVTA